MLRNPTEAGRRPKPASSFSFRSCMFVGSGIQTADWWITDAHHTAASFITFQLGRPAMLQPAMLADLADQMQCGSLVSAYSRQPHQMLLITAQV